MNLNTLNEQANNPNAPEHSQAIGELQRLSVSGDWERSDCDSGSVEDELGDRRYDPSRNSFTTLQALEEATFFRATM